MAEEGLGIETMDDDQQDDGRSLRSTVRKTYAFQVLFQSDSFYFPIVALLWLSSGLGLAQVALLQAIFAITLFAFDLPSGYLTDQWGRKRSLVFGAIALAIGTGGYVIAESFSGFLASELFLALGFALISGADSAMLYDSLKDEGREREYASLWGKAGFYRLVFTSGFNIAGALVAAVSIRAPFYLAFAGMLLVVPIALSFREPRRVPRDRSGGHASQFANTLRYALVTHARLRRMIIFSAIVSAFTLVTLWFYQPYFQLAGVKVAYFGFIFAAFQIAAAIAARYAHYVRERVGRIWMLGGLMGLVVLNYLLIGSFIYWFSFMFMFLLQVSRGMQGVVFSDYLNEGASAGMRSTVLSLSSSIGTLIYGVLLLIFGLLADRAGLGQTFVVTGIALAVIGGFALWPLRRQDNA